MHIIMPIWVCTFWGLTAQSPQITCSQKVSCANCTFWQSVSKLAGLTAFRRNNHGRFGWEISIFLVFVTFFIFLNISFQLCIKISGSCFYTACMMEGLVGEVVVQFYKGDFFYNVLQRFDLINNEHASVRICVKFLDLNCIFLQGNVQRYWDQKICSK